jgi:hypothetical protein
VEAGIIHKETSGREEKIIFTTGLREEEVPVFENSGNSQPKSQNNEGTANCFQEF